MFHIGLKKKKQLHPFKACDSVKSFGFDVCSGYSFSNVKSLFKKGSEVLYLCKKDFKMQYLIENDLGDLGTQQHNTLALIWNLFE